LVCIIQTKKCRNICKLYISLSLFNDDVSALQIWKMKYENDVGSDSSFSSWRPGLSLKSGHLGTLVQSQMT
jgi:hypothetical protein